MIIRNPMAEATMEPPIRVLAIISLELGIIGHPVASAVGAGGDVRKKAEFTGQAKGEVESPFGQGEKSIEVEQEGQGGQGDGKGDEKIGEHWFLGEDVPSIVNGCSLNQDKNEQKFTIFRSSAF